MPIIVLPYALGIVIFPFFSELAILRENEKLRRMLLHGLKLMAFLFVPMAAGLIILRVPVVRILFERGAFGAHSTDLTSSALFYYALGLFSFAVEAVLVQFYFSMFDTKTPIVVGVLCVLLNVLLTVVLFRPLGHRGIALALAVSKSVKVAVLYRLLNRKFVRFSSGELLNFLYRVIAASAGMGLIVYAAGIWSAMISQETLFARAIWLCVMVAGGIAIYLGLLILLRVDEVRVYYGYVRRGAHGMIRRGRR